MQLLELHPARSHALAYRDWCVTFDGSQSFAATGQAILHYFGFRPSDLSDLVTNWSSIRMDILMGAFHPGANVLTTRGSDVAIDPGSSPTARLAAQLLGISSIRRTMMADGWVDAWTTPVAEMAGKAPETLFHGTSDAHLEAVLKSGLVIDAPPNWERGGRDHVYLTATPQTAAFHANRTATRIGGKPVVLSCLRPQALLPDWDVEHRLVRNPAVPSTDGAHLSDEAGLYACPDPISPSGIVKIAEPETFKSAAAWNVIWEQ